MPAKNRVVVNLSDAGMARLQARAVAADLPPAAYAKQVLESFVSDEAAENGTQAEAEQYLMGWVRRVALQYHAAAQWPPDITLVIFERIRQEIPERHAAAVALGQRTMIHRAIGREIKQVLRAETRVENGKLDAMNVPRGQDSLIRRYTRLFPREK